MEVSNKPMVYAPYVYAKSNIPGIWQQKDVVLAYYKAGNEPFHDYMVRGFYTSVTAMLFSRDLVEEVGPWIEESVYEDYHYLWKLTEIVPEPAHTNACCYFYRIHGDQTMGAQANNRIRDEAKVRIFRSLYNEFVPGKSHYNAFTAALLHAKIADTLSQKPALPKSLEDGFQMNYLDSFLKIYMRLENKIGRMFTKNNWQPYHGTNADAEVFQHYLSLL
jgi:hypothetical protein